MIKRFVFGIDEHIYERVAGAIRETLGGREKDRKCIDRVLPDAENALKSCWTTGTRGPSASS